MTSEVVTLQTSGRPHEPRRLLQKTIAFKALSDVSHLSVSCIASESASTTKHVFSEVIAHLLQVNKYTTRSSGRIPTSVLANQCFREPYIQKTCELPLFAFTAEAKEMASVPAIYCAPTSAKKEYMSCTTGFS